MATGPEYVATAAADPAQLRRALLHKRACTSSLHPTEGPSCTVDLASDFLTRSSPLNEQSRAVEGRGQGGLAGTAGVWAKIHVPRKGAEVLPSGVGG